MRAFGYSITVTDLDKAVAFYSRLFSLHPHVEDGRAVFENGFEIYSENERRYSLSLPRDFCFSRTLSDSAVFVSDDFSALLKVLEDGFFKSHVIKKSRSEVVIVDDDFNSIIIRDSGLRSAFLSEGQVSSLREKGFSNWKK